MIERCTDFRLVRKFRLEDVCIDPGYFYLLERNNEKNEGIWFFHPLDDGLSIHANLTIRGRRAKQSALDAIDWIFGHTSVNIIYAVIPSGRKDVRWLANSVGFTFYRMHESGNRIYILNRLERMVA